MQTSSALLDKLKAVRKPYHHDFDINGKCKNCSATIADLPVGKPLTNLDLMCRVITPEEVARFRDDQ